VLLHPRDAHPFSLYLGAVSEDLDPVVVWVEDEGNVTHLAIFGPLLELDAHVVETLARGLEIVDGDADVAETASWLFVSVGVALEVGVGFCTSGLYLLALRVMMGMSEQ